MTPTPEQLAAVLPRCSAGLDGGDWTDDDERLDWARRVLRYVEEANTHERTFTIHIKSPVPTDDDIHATIDWLRSLRRDPHDIRHGDTWEVRDNRTTIVASNDWPPPAGPTFHDTLAALAKEQRQLNADVSRVRDQILERIIHDAEEAQ